MMAVNLGTRGADAARNLVEYCNHPRVHIGVTLENHMDIENLIILKPGVLEMKWMDLGK